jgi:SRSO17 transposase
MMLTHESTPGLVDQDRSVIRGGAAYLNDIERKNSWQLAEISGDATPYAFQHLPRRALWDPEAVRDGLRHYIVQHLGDPEVVLVLDETGFLNKSRHSAGVARQYSGTAGKVDNCQIGVFLGYASRLGHALLDRELYLSEEWTAGRDRCQQAGIPADRSFATKPHLLCSIV